MKPEVVITTPKKNEETKTQVEPQTRIVSFQWYDPRSSGDNRRG